MGAVKGKGPKTEATPRRLHAPSGPGNIPACTVLGIPRSANTDMEEDVSAIEEVGTVTLSSLERSPLLRSLCGRRSFAELEVSNFHVASTRFWEAVLLPCAVVVVVAFSSCLELWIGQCVSLACWYAVNYYAMGYTVQVLHPQNHSECGRLWLSPFGGGVQLALWSVGSAVLEVFLLHSLPSPSVAHMVGTLLYATCGCLWLHLWIAPWRCVPEGWRQMLRRWEDRRKEKRSQAEEPVHESPRRRDAALAAGWRRSTEEGSLAGHAAFAIAGYALLVTFQDVAELRGPWRPNAPSIPAMPMPTMPTMASKARRWTAGAAVETAVSAPQRSRPSRVDARPRMARSRMYSPGAARASAEATAGPALNVSELPRPGRNVSDFAFQEEKPKAHGDSSSPSQGAEGDEGSSGGPKPRRLQSGFQIPDAASALEKAPRSTLDSLVPLGALVIVLLMLLDSGKSLEFSIPHLVCYNLLCLRIPDVLGHWVVTTVTGLQMSPGTTTTAISFAYMAAMQGYLVVLKWVCRHMSAPDMFPRFQFVAQMYYYLFWYMMLMVLAPGGVDDRNFWLMVFFLNGVSLASNAGILNLTRAFLRPGSVPDPPLKVLFDSKLAVQDQLADVVSLLVVPAIATSFHICTSLRVPNYPIGPLLSLWQRFLVLLLARLLSGLLTEEIFRRRAEALELQLLPIDDSQNRTRYLSDICIGPKLALEAMRNIERCELYFATVAVVCTFSVFQKGDWPTRYAFIAFGM